MCPWESNPSRLVDWFVMEKFSAEKFCQISGNLAMVAQQCATNVGTNALVSNTDRIRIARLLDGIIQDCKDIGLKVSALQIKDAVDRLQFNPFTGIQLGQVLIGLNVAIVSEMSTQAFMRMFPERVEFYEQEELFGKAVNDVFPDASRDIRASGSCYAADRNTACVMHLMRVLEVGLNALAVCLGVAWERREWENVINDLEGEIKKINGPHAGSDWRGQQQFYAEAAKDFRYFKNAWRNHAMHAREHYDAAEARLILDHVRTFMVHLANSGIAKGLPK